MDISELAAYAERKHHIDGQLRRRLSVNITALIHPVSGKWVAVLMRRWDPVLGEEVQLCDLKCGHASLRRDAEPYLTAPYRMKGADWVGVRFGEETDRETVFRLFDEAMRASRSWGYTITLGSMLPSGEAEYRETPLPPAEGRMQERKAAVPEERAAPPIPQELRRRFLEAREALRSRIAEITPDRGTPAKETAYRDTPLPPRREAKATDRLREMRRLYDYGVHSFRDNCRNFYKQGKFMEDYEDDHPWEGEVRLYYPTYHDLSLEQLRGYFTWRTSLRRGQFGPIAASLAYIYLYELLNGIGAADAADSLRKLREFEAGFLDAGLGDGEMRRNLRRWMLEKAVVSGLPPEIIREYADPEMLQKDAALAALKDPRTRSDGEIFDALTALGGRKLLQSPVVQQHGDEGKALFARVWRLAAGKHRQEGKTLFTLCFGGCRSHRWDPLSNAVYFERSRPAPGTCQLTECRSYAFNGGLWSEKCYQERSFDKKLLGGLLHETDRQLRLYLHLGRSLQERWEEAWADPYIEAVIREDRQARAEAERKKVRLDLGSLERIRQDALLTRDSLLTEEELPEAEAPAEAVAAPEEASPAVEAPAASEEAAPAPDLPLSGEQAQLLSMLLRGQSVKDFLARQRRMPSVVADAINEALYDEVGDSILECDGDEITLAEDYREDVLRLLGGTIE